MCIRDSPFLLPEIPCYLNELLASEDFYGGIEPQIGRKHICVIAIDGFPKMSSSGILRELDSLPIEYRWNCLLYTSTSCHRELQPHCTRQIGAVRCLTQPNWIEHPIE